MAVTGVSPLLVGRRAELEQLTDALARAAGGEPAVLLVGGDAGVGKSRLIVELAKQAAASGARVLTGACVEGGGDGLPFAPVVDLLRTVVRDTPESELDLLLGRSRPEVARLLPEVSSGQQPAAEGGSSAQLFELLLGVFARLADGGPVLLLIEDLHWADQSTLDFVAFLARALRDVRVLLVATYRSDEMHRRHPLRTLLTTWERSRLVARLDLVPFTAAEVREQLIGIVGEEPQPDLVRLVYDRSEGNAFLVEEILGAVQGGADPNNLPDSLRDVLISRVDQLSEPAQQVLRTASVAGRWVAERLLAAVTDLPDRDLYAALREAVERHLLVVDDAGRGYAFRHALTRDVVYSDMLPGERGALHLAYGEALSADPSLGGEDASTAATLAHHWYAALELPKALVASTEAAQLASSASAYAEAQHHLERALEVWPRVPDAGSRTGTTFADLLGLAGVAAFRAGQVDRALILADRAVAALPPDAPATERALQLERRAEVLRGLARDDDAAADLRAGLAVLGEAATGQRAVMLAALASTMSLADPAEGLAVATAAVDDATVAGLPVVAANAMASLAVSQAYYGDLAEGLATLRQSLELALGLGDAHLTLRCYINLADLLEMSALHDEAVEVAATGVALAQETGYGRSLGAFLVGNQMEPLLKLGRWEEVERLASTALLDGPTGVFRSSILELLAQLAVYRGDLGTADGLVKVANAAAGAGWQYSLPLAVTAAEVARGQGDPAAAREIVRDLLERRAERPDARYLLPLLAIGYRVEGDLAQEARREDQPGAGAEVQLRLLDRLTAGFDGRTPGERAQLAVIAAERARLVGDGERRTLWASAVDAAGDAGDTYLILYTRLQLATVELEDGDRAAASRQLQLVADRAQQLQAKPLRDQALDLGRRARLQLAEPAASGETLPSLQRYGLTDREHVVLSHVAAGRSNAQIAGALYISPKTASVHVSNILAKLGVSGRVEAAALAYRLGVVPVDDPS